MPGAASGMATASANGTGVSLSLPMTPQLGERT